MELKNLCGTREGSRKARVVALLILCLSNSVHFSSGEKIKTNKTISTFSQERPRIHFSVPWQTLKADIEILKRKKELSFFSLLKISIPRPLGL